MYVQHAGDITVTFAAIGSLIKQIAESSGRSFGDVFVEAMVYMIYESEEDHKNKRVIDFSKVIK